MVAGCAGYEEVMVSVGRMRRARSWYIAGYVDDLQNGCGCSSAEVGWGCIYVLGCKTGQDKYKIRQYASGSQLVSDVSSSTASPGDGGRKHDMDLLE
jgi:hypothetical protein